jgi:hypothetical protein
MALVGFVFVGMLPAKASDLLELTQDDYSTTSSPLKNVDVVGLRIGMPHDKANLLLQAEYTGTKPQTESGRFNKSYPPFVVFFNTEQFFLSTTAWKSTSGDGGSDERVVIQSVPTLQNNPVFSITREVTYNGPLKQPDLATFESAILQKYGKPTVIDNSSDGDSRGYGWFYNQGVPSVPRQVFRSETLTFLERADCTQGKLMDATSFAIIEVRKNDQKVRKVTFTFADSAMCREGYLAFNRQMNSEAERRLKILQQKAREAVPIVPKL